MRKPLLPEGGSASGKQPVSLQQTSGSGELTSKAVAFRLRWRWQNFPRCPTAIISQVSQSPLTFFVGVRLSAGNTAVSGRQGSARRSRAAPMNGDFIAALDSRPHRRCRVAKAAMPPYPTAF